MNNVIKPFGCIQWQWEIIQDMGMGYKPVIYNMIWFSVNINKGLKTWNSA